MRRRRATARSAVRRTVFVVIFLLMFNYLILPRLTAAGDSADLIRRVNPVLLALALGLEVASWFAYSVLTRVTLPGQPRLRLPTVFRIQLATKAVTNLVPGGSAAGGTLGYRLLTERGVPPPAAGFTLASVGLGSAVVLNVMLWLALLVSIPLNGFNPLYGTAAIVGLFLMLGMAALVLLLMKGGTKAERLFQGIARKIPFLNEVTVSRIVYQLADRLHDLMSQPRLIRRGLLWAAVNWLLDAAALWVFLRAFGGTVSPVNLIVAFGLANVLAVIPITPGGLGVVEAALTPTLVGFGLTHSTATIGVLAYRFAQFWLPIPLGGLSYASLKLGPGRRRRLAEVRKLATDTGTIADKRVWDPVTGELLAVGTNRPLRRAGTPSGPPSGGAADHDPAERPRQPPPADDDHQRRKADTPSEPPSAEVTDHHSAAPPRQPPRASADHQHDRAEATDQHR